MHDDLKEKIAPVPSDFECGCWPLSLMGFADRRLYRSNALKAWREKKPQLFVKKIYEHTGLDR